MQKKLFSFFLLLVLATQMLPLRQIGSVQFRNQINEELPHSIDIEKEGFQKNLAFSDYLSAAPMAVVSALAVIPFLNDRSADSIPQKPAGEILVPPPNC